MPFVSASPQPTTPHHSQSFRFTLGKTVRAKPNRGHRKPNKRVASIFGGGGGGYDDPGSWDVSPEWWGTQGGGWGRNEGSTVFEKESLHGNGLVTVTAHPAQGNPSQPQTGTSEWRVLRFNGVTRQSVNRVVQVQGSSDLSVDPNCLAFEYLKTMAVAGWLLLERGRNSEVELCFIGGGGFTLPAFFSNLYPKSHVQSVEIDPIVIEAATSHMGISKEKNIVIEGDAVDFLPKCMNAGDQFDCICIDAFDGEDAIPGGLSDPDGSFLPSLADALHPENGSVIINVHGGKISPSLNPLALFKSDPGFDETSVAGKSVKKIIDAFSNVVLGGNASKGCCFTLSTAHQDNIIVVVSRGLPRTSDSKTLKEIFKDIAGKDVSRLPFDPQPRFERSLSVW
ncbi:hypothetical protein BSKO_08408 [Bryopsis sp. KO-2023]|nr:hypothetical protein BSKO_08408 [Bryopsis sp. KO-2023]